MLNAHYTHSDYVDSMWEAAKGLGVPAAAHVLEAGCGTGNFLTAAPETAKLTGVELDPTTAAIARLLNPSAEIRNESFAVTVLDHDGYDLTIGNVPFSRTKLYDPAYNQAKLSLHNHFIVKALRQTKPGGIVMVMTSRWTLDGKAERSRREIAKHGELLGAVRMPAGAHGEIAGTDAIIDVLVLRRHLGEAPEVEPGWLRTADVEGAAGAARMNQYFLEHPSQVLGAVGTRIGQFGPELTVSAEDVTAESVAPQLSAALQKVVEQAVGEGRTWAAADSIVTDRPMAVVHQDPARMIGHISKDESGHLVQARTAGTEPVNVPKNAAQELGALIDLRDAAVQLLEAEAATSENTEAIAALRLSLNDYYDRYVSKYGPLGRVSTSVRERPGKDPLITRRYPAAIRALREDPHFATVVALERFNEDTGEARKATIFHERVVGVTREVDRVDNPDDAIRVSLDRLGYVDIPLVAELLDVDEESTPDLLGDRVFLSPADQTSYLPAEEYLSGNVRQKRDQVLELAASDPRFERHLNELQKIIPAEVGPEEIDVKFGASWIEISDVKQFIEKELGKELKAIERIDGDWRFELRGKATQSAEGRWQVTGDHVSEGAAAVFKRVLNGDKLELRYRSDPSDPKSPMLVDQVATEALQERATELHDAFQDWLWSDAERADRLQTRYNDLYNGIVLRSYDHVRLTFPGKAASFTPHPHQHAAVARMLAEPAVGLFHEVGAGKTAEMVLGVSELKRLGMVQKPCIIVPNQMLEQFTREFKQIYPRAKVLAAGGEDLTRSATRDGRKAFVARARTGDWDAVIMTHSSFGKIGLGAATADYAKQRLTELEEILQQKLASEMSTSVKKLESALQTQQEKLKKMLDLDHDQGVSWDETGIDYLCVDEAHLFKNLTVMSKVGDLSKPDGAQRATDLDMKLWYHREHLGQSRVATLATATPLPNSMIEMYVMQRYLRPDLLKAAEVFSADDWARQFTEQVTQVETKVEGGFQINTRTTKFRNLPELLLMWHVAGDIKTQQDLGLPVPKLQLNEARERAPEMVTVPPTETQVAGMADLMERGEAVRAGNVEPEEDNLLKITSNGRALALDPRLLGYEPPAEGEPVKVAVAAESIYQLWREHKDMEYVDEWGDLSPVTGSLQLVFSDLGTPNDDGRWDVYTQLRADLVKKGIPATQIRFIHEAANDKAKAELFQQCRDGRVQVLIGSTEKMGVGTNVQARAIALHHLDAPWRPADVTQREGRLVRQGNQNSEVLIRRYATEGSFDSYMWGTLARKAQFIEQVLAGRHDVREVDNSSEVALQFAEMQAVAMGDTRLLEVANLRQETQKLDRQQRAHQRKISTLQARALLVRSQLNLASHDLEALQKLAPAVVDTKGDLFSAELETNRFAQAPKFRERKDFGQALRHAVQTEISRFNKWEFTERNAHYPKPLSPAVTIGGVRWTCELRWNTHDAKDPMLEFHAGKTHEALHVKMLYSRVLDGELSSLSRSFEQQSAGIPDLVEAYKERVQSITTEHTELTRMGSEVWPKSDYLTEQRQRLASLVAELESEAAPPQVAQATVPAAEPVQVSDRKNALNI